MTQRSPVYRTPRVQRIEAALLESPIMPEIEAPDLLEEAIAILDAAVAGQFANQVAQEVISRTAVISELDRFSASCMKMAEKFVLHRDSAHGRPNGLSPTAYDILDYCWIYENHPPSLLNRACISEDLHIWARLATRGAELLRQGSELQEDVTAPRGGGRPPELVARAIAERAAQAYWRLTGRRPTIGTFEGDPSGPFLDLVRALFSIFDLTASPLHHARRAAGGPGAEGNLPS